MKPIKTKTFDKDLILYWTVTIITFSPIIVFGAMDVIQKIISVIK